MVLDGFEKALRRFAKCLRSGRYALTLRTMRGTRGYRQVHEGRSKPKQQKAGPPYPLGRNVHPCTRFTTLCSDALRASRLQAKFRAVWRASGGCARSNRGLENQSAAVAGRDKESRKKVLDKKEARHRTPPPSRASESSQFPVLGVDIAVCKTECTWRTFLTPHLRSRPERDTNFAQIIQLIRQCP